MVSCELATGSEPIRLPVPGADKHGVITFRNLDDVEVMKETAAGKHRAVVIGGGLLGLEAAYGLVLGGAKVTLVHLMDRLMERQLDPESALMLADAMRARGVEIILEAQTVAITGETHATGVTLSDGRHVPAELVVLAAGIRPNAELAKGCGLAVGRGIVVDDGLATSDPDVFAIGECAEHHGMVYGLVEPAYEQAEVLAARLSMAARKSAPEYHGSLTATNLKVSGVNLFSAGDFMGNEGTEFLIMRDHGLGHYRKLVLKDDRLVGAVLFGNTMDALWYLDLIRSGADVTNFRSQIIFGRALVEQLGLAMAA